MQIWIKHIKVLWQEMSAATTILLLKVVNLGLGVIWLGIASREEKMNKIKEIFDLPEEIKLSNIISLAILLKFRKYNLLINLMEDVFTMGNTINYAQINLSILLNKLII